VVAPPLAADPLLIALVSTLLGGSGLLAIVALVRAPKQNKMDVVQMQHVIYQELRSELDTCQEQLEVCRRERHKMRLELEAEQGEIDFLRERITNVEGLIRSRQEQARAGGEAEKRRVIAEDLPELYKRPDQTSD
jgi:uncharacterized protein (DUF3084 family)